MFFISKSTLLELEPKQEIWTWTEQISITTFPFYSTVVGDLVLQENSTI